MKKLRTIRDIKCDPRVERLTRNYAGFGVHMVELKDGYRFDFDTTIEIGNVKEICESLNNSVYEQ